jgi:signal transduction histidine kinase
MSNEENAKRIDHDDEPTRKLSAEMRPALSRQTMTPPKPRPASSHDEEDDATQDDEDAEVDAGNPPLTLEELQEQVEELAFLQRLDRELTWVLNQDHVLNITMDWLMRRTAAQAGLIALRKDDKLQVVRVTGADPQTAERLQRELWPVGTGIVSQVFKQRNSIYLNKLAEKNEFTPIITDKAKSMFSYPLIIKAEVLGVVHLESIHENHFSPDMIQFVEQVSRRASVALRNAEIYDKAHNAEQLKSDMIRMAAHDLRNPLNTIKTALAIVKSQIYPASDIVQMSLASVDQAVQHMQMLIEELLTLEKLEANVEMSQKPVNLVPVLHDAITRLQSSIESKEHEVILAAGNRPIIVQGEAGFYRQAMINLISNAVKYTPTKGKITIRLQQHGSKALFDVKDNGYGISKEQQTRLYQRFYRATDDTTSHIEGTGLGLSLVKAIIERARGEVWFESEADVGSTFGFWLPIATDINPDEVPIYEAPTTIDFSAVAQRRRARQGGQSFQ